MHYRVQHLTVYEYEMPVLYGRHRAHQRLRSTERQSVLRSELLIQPQPGWARRERDAWGNWVDSWEILEPHERLSVRAESLVEVYPNAHLEEALESRETWESVVERIQGDRAALREREFSYDSPLVNRHRELRSWGARSFLPGRPMGELISEVNQRIQEEFLYAPASTDVSTSWREVLREKRGVCQDFAHLAVGVLRSYGLAARYVSGYLLTQPPAGQARLVGADASHAWVSVWVPGWGWLDFDPTNNLFPNEEHIVVSWGRDYSDVSPLRGVIWGGGKHRISIGVDVVPLTEAELTEELAERSAEEFSPSRSSAS